MCPIQDGSLGLASGLFDGGARCLTELDLCFGIHDMPSLCAALYAKVGLFAEAHRPIVPRALFS